MTRKPTAIKPRKTAAKPAEKTANKATGTASAESSNAGAEPKLRKSDFIDRVATRAALKKNQVKPVLEAALAVLGDALEAGETLQLPPLGRLKVRKMTENDKGKSIVCQVRRNTAMKTSAVPGLSTDHDGV